LRAYAAGITAVDEFERLEKDDSFQCPRGDPRLDTLLAAARQRIAAAQKQPATR
jgi:hypothetical protein